MSALRLRRYVPILWVWVLLLLGSALTPPAYVRGVGPLPLEAVHLHVGSSSSGGIHQPASADLSDGSANCCHEAQILCVFATSHFLPAQAVRLIPPLGRAPYSPNSQTIFRSVVSLVPTPPPRA
ncbi:MAG: hypothetical protein SFU83_06970 [Meiothermus sp.]|nr:hypothetical protein [Meiothermus sp.]